jgi:hypothetical protein
VGTLGWVIHRVVTYEIFRDQARGYDLNAAASDLPLSLSPSDKFEDASPQGRAHAQSSGHPVRSLLARPLT